MLPPEYAEAGDELLFALHHRDRPTLVFLEVNSPRKAAELARFLTESLPEYQFCDIDLTPYPTVSLLRSLTEQLPAAVINSKPVQYVANVRGLENSLLVSRDGRIQPSELTAQLNLERELLFRNVPYIILLWADTYFFRTLQREAPDLWSWVTYKFRFEDTEALTPDQHPALPPKRLAKPGNIPDRHTRILELENTLNRLDQNTEDKIRLQRDKISILHLLAQEYEQTYEFTKAEEAYQKAIAIAERIGADDFHRAQLSFDLAGLYQTTRQFDKAIEGYESAKILSPDNFLGSVYHRIGMVYDKQRQWPQALASYQQAIDWYTKTGNEFALGSTYHQIGMVYDKQRQWPQALTSYQQAIDWKTKTGNEFALGSTYHQIGMVYAEQRQWSQALASYQQSIDWKIKTGNKFKLGGTYHQIGRVYQEQRQWPQALASYQQAIDWYIKTGNEFKLGGTYHQIGIVYQGQQQWPKALASYQQSIDWKIKTGNEFELGSTYHQIGRVYQEQRQWPQALTSYQQAIDWKTKTGNEFALGSTYHQIGRVYEEQEDWEAALVWFQKSVESLTRFDNPKLPIAQESLARVQAKLDSQPDQPVKMS
jgi:tetratricopeptide (TPR) repeat protein